MNRALVLVVCLGGALGQMRLRGTCDPDVKGMENFKIRKLGGRYYANEVLGDGTGIGRCPAITLGSDSRRVSYITYLYTEHEPKRIHAFANTVNNGDFNMLELPFSSTDSNKVPYQVLDTDHSDYIFLYYCKQETVDTKIVTAFKLSNNIVLSSEHAREMAEVASRYPELQHGPWKVYDQSNCDVYHL